MPKDWLNPDSPDWFADYTGVVVKALTDREANWMTLNEPQSNCSG
jgi:beta-glucosidase